MTEIGELTFTQLIEIPKFFDLTYDTDEDIKANTNFSIGISKDALSVYDNYTSKTVMFESECADKEKYKGSVNISEIRLSGYIPYRIACTGIKSNVEVDSSLTRLNVKVNEEESIWSSSDGIMKIEEPFKLGTASKLPAGTGITELKDKLIFTVTQIEVEQVSADIADESSTKKKYFKIAGTIKIELPEGAFTN